jgi:hypothetical protein
MAGEHVRKRALRALADEWHLAVSRSAQAASKTVLGIARRAR